MSEKYPILYGLADEELLKIIRELYPTDNHEVKVSSPLAFGLCFYEVTET